jgi:dCMP deaminase
VPYCSTDHEPRIREARDRTKAHRPSRHEPMPAKGGMMTREMDPRPERSEYLLSMAVDQAARCNCRKTAVGAVIVRDDRIISTGYNGTIAGFANCIDGGCPRCADATVISGSQLDRCICVHAEQNALLAAARFGVRVEGAACWVTNEPCLDCTKQLIQAELAMVNFWRPYRLPNRLLTKCFETL